MKHFLKHILFKAFCLLVFLAASPIYAQERLLTSEEIQTLLPTVIVSGNDTTQTFEASGITDYAADRPSRGHWRIEGNRYCSQWPPSAVWVCYEVYADVSVNPKTIVWIDPSGNRIENTFKQRNETK